MSGILRLFSAALNFFIIFCIAKLYNTAQAADYFFIAALSNFGSIFYKHGSELKIIRVDFTRSFRQKKFIEFRDGLKKIVIISLYSVAPISIFILSARSTSTISNDAIEIVLFSFFGAISISIASLYQEYSRAIGEQIKGIMIATILPYMAILVSATTNYKFGSIDPHVFFVSSYLIVASIISFRAKIFDGFKTKHFKLERISKTDFFVSVSIRAIEPNAAVIVSKLLLTDESVVAIAIITRIGAIVQIFTSAITFGFPAEFAQELRNGAESARTVFHIYRKNMLLVSGSLTITLLISSYQILEYFELQSPGNFFGLTSWLVAILFCIALGPARLALLIQPNPSIKLFSAALSTGSVILFAVPGALYYGVPGLVLSVSTALITSTLYSFLKLKKLVI